MEAPPNFPSVLRKEKDALSSPFLFKVWNLSTKQMYLSDTIWCRTAPNPPALDQVSWVIKLMLSPFLAYLAVNKHETSIVKTSQHIRKCKQYSKKRETPLSSTQNYNKLVTNYSRLLLIAHHFWPTYGGSSLLLHLHNLTLGGVQ